MNEPKFFDMHASIIKEKTENWDIKEEIENFINYEECLFCANCFDIEGLQKKLDGWNIDNCKEVKWYIKKAFLFNIFGYNTESTKLIEKALTVKTENSQEKLWLLEIANIYSFFERKTIDIRQKEIEALKQKKYYTLENLTGYLIEKITETYNGKQDKKAIPVDEKRNKGRSITHTVNQPERNRSHYTISLLYLFEEIGINVMTNHIHWYKFNENILNVLIENFEAFFMHMYSAFGYDSSENLARKVCQNIIFNENTDTKDIKYLFDGLFRILKYKIENDENARMELFPLSEFIRRLKYDDWKELAEFLIEKLEDTENNQVINLFINGNIWGWGKPFRKIYSLMEDEEIKERFRLFFFNVSQKEHNIGNKNLIEDNYIEQQHTLYKKAITSSNKQKIIDKIIIFEKLKEVFSKLKHEAENHKESPFYDSMDKSMFSNNFLILYELVAKEKEFLNSNATFNNFFEDVKTYYFENFTELDNWKDII